MADLTPLPGDDSKLLGVSVRGWIVFFMVFTVCAMSVHGIVIAEPLYSGFSLGLGFYLGQKSK